MLQTTFLVADITYFKTYDEAVAIIELLYKGTEDIARKHKISYISTTSFTNVVTARLLKYLIEIISA
jgi:hypothetical protein